MKKVAIKCQGADLKEVDQLVTFQGNIKKLTKGNLEKLKKAIIKHGFCAPVFIWKHKKKFYILDGHQRIKAVIALREDGYTVPSLPVAYIQAGSEKEAKEKLLHITSQYGEFDKVGLDEFIFEADLDISELDTLRLTDTEFKIGGDSQLPDTAGDDEVPEDVPSITKTGDVWELGKHRVICGDSLNPETLETLLKEGKADLLLTDPPYNVDYTGKTKEALKIKNDKKKDEEFLCFLTRSFSNAISVMKSGASFYIWHADSEGHNFRSACRQAGFEIKQCLIWNKNCMVMGRQDYHWKHEPCLYGWKKGASHKWYGDRKQTTILEFDRPSRSSEHPTMKPVDLLAYLILNSSKEEDQIIDPFLGSGSTLIACEKTGRLCFGAEIDERYCDVIVNRYLEWCEGNNREPEIKLNGKRIDEKRLKGKTHGKRD